MSARGPATAAAARASPSTQGARLHAAVSAGPGRANACRPAPALGFFRPCPTPTPTTRRATRPHTAVHAQWLENTAEVEVAAPLDACWDMWEDRTRIPSWMPWIKAVTIQADDPKLSRWVLSTDQFGRTWEFSWLARNLAPVRHQKIHWTSVPGSSTFGSALDIANRGAIRFYKKGAASTGVKLTISYEVPDGLAPFASAVTPLVERILRTDMGRFKDLAEQEVKKGGA